MDLKCYPGSLKSLPLASLQLGPRSSLTHEELGSTETSAHLPPL